MQVPIEDTEQLAMPMQMPVLEEDMQRSEGDILPVTVVTCRGQMGTGDKYGTSEYRCLHGSDQTVHTWTQVPWEDRVGHWARDFIFL